MTTSISDDALSQFGQLISSKAAKKNAGHLFENHPQLSLIADIINRKYTHHLLIQTDLPLTCLTHFCEVLHAALSQDSKKASLLMLQLETRRLLTDAPSVLDEQQLTALAPFLNQLKQPLLICIYLPDTLSGRPALTEQFLQLPLIRQFSDHPLCRILAFTTSHAALPRWLQQDYAVIHLSEPSDTDILNILKLERITLETYHQVIIPDELLTQAHDLATRYLSAKHPIEQTILLLDSSAARTHQQNIREKPADKPVLSHQTLVSVLSSWTHIPIAQLIPHHFSVKDFLDYSQRLVFGQDAALQLIAKQLHHDLNVINGQTLTHFLLAGPDRSGKKTLINTIAHYFYKQSDMIYYTNNLVNEHTTLLDLTVKQKSNSLPLTIKSLISKTPYAIIVFENIDQAPPTILDDLYHLLSHGVLQDSTGANYHFQHSLILLTTNYGWEQLNPLATQTPTASDSTSHNLLQLVMNEKRAEETSAKSAPDILAQQLKNELNHKLPPRLTRMLNVIPFLPLNKSAIEKMIRLQLKEAGQRLQKEYAVDLGYAPEVVRYLTQCALSQHKQHPNLKLSAQELNDSIEEALRHIGDKRKQSNQLFLQLNETGEILRCDWLLAPPVKQHAT